MRHLERIDFSVKKIVEDCASSFRNEALRKRYIDSARYIEQKSEEYVDIAVQNKWDKISAHKRVNAVISKDDMVKLYDKKFVMQPDVREKYYDKILASAKSGKCPVCGIGQASTLDHYLAKTLYPTYAVTPDNLVPVCRDCNGSKGNRSINSIREAPFHPYFDDIDDIIWLCTDITSKNGILVARYFVDAGICKDDPEKYERLCAHLKLYKLKNAYSIQASTEISENTALWKNLYEKGGKRGLLRYFSECLSSCEAVQRNTWKTALIRGLINAVKNNLSV